MQITQIVSKWLDANSYVLSRGDTALVIDAGASVEQISEAIGDKTLAGILLTHGHFDHCISAVELAEKYDCKIFASKEAKAIMADAESNYGKAETPEGKDFFVTDFSRFCFFEGDGNLKIADFDIKFVATPGHSPCSTCFFVEGNLFAGDVLFNSGIGRTDLIGSSRKDMLLSLKKLQDMEFEVCYSGHGQSSDRQRQERNLRAFIRMLSRGQ